MSANTRIHLRSQAKPKAESSINLIRVLGWVVAAILIFITLFPFWWLIRTALTSQQQILNNTQSLLPVDPTLDNFRRVLGLVDSATAHAQGGSASINLLLNIRNTVIVSALITLGQVSF